MTIHVLLVRKANNTEPLFCGLKGIKRKVDEGFLVGYRVCSKAFRVFSSRTRIVQETLHVNFMENKPNVAGSSPAWLFDIDSLTRTMNYHPVITENQTNSHVGFQDTEKAGEEGTHTYVLFPVVSNGSTNSQNNNKDALVDGKEHDDDIQKSVSPDIHSSSSEFEECTNNNSNGVNAASSLVSTTGHNFINSTNDFSAAGPSNATASPTAANSSDMPNLEDLTHSDDADDVGEEADINNLESITSTRSMARTVRDQSGISQMFNEDFHTCMVFNLPMLHLLRVEMVINSPWMLSKNWLVQKQTAFGKDISNPFMADNLPKIVWFSTHHVTFMKSWLVQKQTALGQTTTSKETSNPFMAGSLPKTIMLSFLQIICFHMSPFEFTFVYLVVTSMKKIVISEDAIHEILQFNDAKGVVCLPNEEIFAGLAQMGYEKPSTKLTFYKAFFSSQWKFLIHTLVQSLSAKRTSWNEFSTAMDSAVICLSKGQKFNFSKYIFGSLVRNVDSSSKFYMYPRFIQLIIQNQVGDLSTHTTRQLAEEGIAEEQVQADVAVAAAVQDNVADDGAKFPTHIQQILDACSALTRRVENLEHDKATQKLEIIKLKARVKRLERANKVKSSKLRRLRKVRASRRIESSDDMKDVFNQRRMIDDLDKDKGIELVKDVDIPETEGRHAAEQAEKQTEIYHLDLDHPSKVLSMQEDDSEVQEVVEVVTTAKLITDVVTAASQDSTASATISAAKPSIPAVALTVVAAYIRRRKGVIIRDPEEELSLKTHTETPDETPKLKDKGKGILVETPKPMKKKDQIKLDAEYERKLHEEFNQDHEEINKDIDWDAAIDHINQKSKNPQYIKRYQGMKKRPQTESEARKNMMIYLKNPSGYKMDFFKGMSYDEICPIFQARFDENMRFLFKSREEIEEEDQKVLKSINETPAQKAAKRRKLNEEAQEAEDLKKHLEVVDDEDDDVFIEATPLARKVPVVDYQIVLIDNKPRFRSLEQMKLISCISVS
uniref:Ribonuclease H-like domain-containing protein n=1 Tax=Tanacetum cinerariifolium TaxID=118510 RepID=A0A6L2LL84_TANCI|nr:ribonuclease H-like domain-containing protein [Tanacetum cinerariifolium]